MKKILIFMVLLLTVFLSGCYYNDLEKFEKMMEIPMDSNYIIYEVDGYDSGYYPAGHERGDDCYRGSATRQG